MKTLGMPPEGFRLCKHALFTSLCLLVLYHMQNSIAICSVLEFPHVLSLA